jgi:hypothetical protein
MLTVSGLVTCDMPDCQRTATCTVTLRNTGVMGGFFGFGLFDMGATPSPIHEVKVNDPQQWLFYGVMGQHIACGAHSKEAISAQYEREAEADRDRRAQEREAEQQKRPTPKEKP